MFSQFNLYCTMMIRAFYKNVDVFIPSGFQVSLQNCQAGYGQLFIMQIICWNKTNNKYAAWLRDHNQKSQGSSKRNEFISRFSSHKECDKHLICILDNFFVQSIQFILDMKFYLISTWKLILWILKHIWKGYIPNFLSFTQGMSTNINFFWTKLFHVE